jgi:polyisoprenoid-binding protein YceI
METVEALTKTKWGIDSVHSEISFKVKHLMITNVKGVFKEIDGDIYSTNEKLMTADINIRINPASIDTGDSKRDEHLKSADFFDVENHKQITFKGISYDKVDDNGNYKLFGDLTIKDISQRVKLDVEFGGVMKDPWGNQKAGFTVNGKINRKDWGLNWNAALEAGGVLVSDEVKISCELQLVKIV